MKPCFKESVNGVSILLEILFWVDSKSTEDSYCSQRWEFVWQPCMSASLNFDYPCTRYTFDGLWENTHFK